MDSNRDLDITNAQDLIELLREEEHRLRAIISHPLTSPKVRSEAHARLGDVVENLRKTASEVATMQALRPGGGN